MDEDVSLVLFSGTDDKLNAAAVLTAGAAAMGRRVHIFLQYWALDAWACDDGSIALKPFGSTNPEISRLETPLLTTCEGGGALATLWSGGSVSSVDEGVIAPSIGPC